MTLIEKNILKSIFTDIMMTTGVFSYEDGSPFMVNYKGRDIFVYVKNITPAYFRGQPDITRVQLPFRPHYDRISNSDIPFIILGYDQKNDVFVNWNPNYIKGRLNSKSNVSLYSKNSLQDHVTSDGIIETLNVNGDKQVYFKRHMLPLFFDTFTSIYDFHAEILADSNPKEGETYRLPAELKQKILPLVPKGDILKAIEICSQYEPKPTKKMSFKEWFQLVNPLFDTEGY